MFIQQYVRSLLFMIGLTMLVGCGTANDPRTQEPSRPKTAADLMMEQHIAAVIQVTEAYKSGAPSEEIHSLTKKMDQAGEAWATSGLDPEEIDNTMQRYSEEFDKAIRGLTKAAMKGGGQSL